MVGTITQSVHAYNISIAQFLQEHIMMQIPVLKPAVAAFQNVKKPSMMLQFPVQS